MPNRAQKIVSNRYCTTKDKENSTSSLQANHSDAPDNLSTWNKFLISDLEAEKGCFRCLKLAICR